MCKRLLALTLFCLLCPVSVQAEGAVLDLLSDEFHKCHDNGKNTVDFRSCASEEYDRQNAKLEETYASLIAWLKGTGNEKAIPFLQQAQADWLKYRDAEMDYTFNEGGTLWPQVGLQWGASMAVLRIKEFENIMHTGHDELKEWQ